MLALIKADYFRIFRSRGFWIAQLLILGVVYLTASGGQFSIGASVAEESPQVVLRTAYDTMLYASHNFSNYYFLYLPFFVIIVATDFTKKLYKNTITIGVSRGLLVVTKWVEFLLLNIVESLLIYGLSFGIASLRLPLGHLSADAWLNLFLGFLLQVAVIQIAYTLALVVLVVTKSTVLLTVFVFTWSIIITILYLFLKNDLIMFVSVDAILSNVQSILANNTLLAKTLGVQFGLFIVGFLASIQIFKRQSL